MTSDDQGPKTPWRARTTSRNGPVLGEAGEAYISLLCPGCGNHNLHQYAVEVFNRYQEDDPAGLHVVIDGQSLNRDMDMGSNPSARRDGMFIYFACEYCPGIVRLSIAQHNGDALVSSLYLVPEDA